MHACVNTTATVTGLLASLPGAVRVLVLVDDTRPYWLQPQTVACLEALLQQLASPAFSQLTVVQTQEDAQCMPSGSPFVWLDATVATASILTHKPSDFVVTAGVGQTITGFNTQLALHQQTVGYTPAVMRFFPPDFNPTLADCLAYNWLPLEAGIRRTTLNELVLGVAGYAASTGQRVAFGGEVVKNVTGYDVQKFLVGHQYSLGLVSQVTLKTVPVLPIQGVMVQSVPTLSALCTTVALYLAQPSLWVSSVVVLPRKATVTDDAAFLLAIGVAVPTAELLQQWQKQWAASAVWQEAMPPLWQAGQSLPALVLEVALPCGLAGQQSVFDTILPLFGSLPLQWQLLPACGVLQLAFTTDALPSIEQLYLLQQQVALLGGAVKVVYATAAVESLKNKIHQWQWEQLPLPLQRYTQQLKQQIDPNQQFWGRYALGTSLVVTKEAEYLVYE